MARVPLLLVLWAAVGLASSLDLPESKRSPLPADAPVTAALETALWESTSPLCRNHSIVFLQQLRNFTLWAVQMFDASTKFPRGVLSGNVYNMGDFDECLAVRGPSNIRGQYCLSRVDVEEDPKLKDERRKLSGPTDPYTLHYDPLVSAWEKIEYKGDPSKHRRDQIYWAICAPSSCSSKEVEAVAEAVISAVAKQYGATAQVTVADNMCKKQTEVEFSAADGIYIAVVAFVILWSVSSTTYDWKFKAKDSKPGGMKALFLCFSMKQSFKKLPSLASNSDGLRVIFGLKVLSMMAVVLCHKYGVSIGGAATNVDSIEESNRVVLHMLTMHGDLVVDTFFALGAFLLAYATMRHSEMYGKAPVSVMVFFRYVRLTPAYAMVIFFYACVLNKLGSGPLWNSTAALDAQACLDNWWTNILYISNYVKTNEMCMVQSWYLPCDTHYFIIGAMIMVLLYQRPLIGQLTLLFFTAASIAIPFAVTLANHYDATVLFYRDFLFDPRANTYFNQVYIKSHMRAGPYFAGIIGGYLFYKLRLHEKKMSRFWACIIFAVSNIVFWIVMFSGAIFYIPDRPYHPLEAAIYAGMQRFAWGAAVCTLVISLASGKIPFVSSFLGWTPFVILGKLTYCAYLVHFIFQLFSLSVDRSPKYITNYYMFLLTAGELAFVFLSALVLYLVVEAPCRDIAKLLIFRGRELPSPPTKQEDPARPKDSEP